MTLTDDAVHGCQAQARAFALFLGREERLEQVLSRLGRQARAVVRHPQPHAVARRQLIVRVRGGGERHLEADMPARGHGIARVDHQVQQHLLERVRIDADNRRHRSQTAGQGDVLVKKARQHVPEVGDSLVDVHLPRDRHLLPAESEQLMRELASPLSGRLDFLELVAIDSCRMTGQEQLGVAEHRGQQVVEVVRDAAGELSHRLDLLHLPELFFHQPLFGDIFANHDELGEGPVLVCHSLAAEADGGGAAVLARPLDLEAVEPARSMDLLKDPGALGDVAIERGHLQRQHRLRRCRIPASRRTPD